MAWVQTAGPGMMSAVAEVERAPAGLPDVSWSHPEAGLRASGYGAAARQALREAVEIAAKEDVGHLLPMLPAAARLLPKEDVEQLAVRVERLPSIAINDARRTEADAVLKGDRDRFLEAATLYREVGMPYEEGRCLAAAGDENAAATLFKRLGVPSPRAL